VDQKILQSRHIGLFTANTDLGASLSFGRLLTLITKHILSPFPKAVSKLSHFPKEHT
jgi:hypothetical protein